MLSEALRSEASTLPRLVMLNEAQRSEASMRWIPRSGSE